jgi:hypothetical protein
MATTSNAGLAGEIERAAFNLSVAGHFVYQDGRMEASMPPLAANAPENV